MQSHVISEVETKPGKAIDREKCCPFLLRIFCASIRHNSILDYKNGCVPGHSELQIYTWLDCTLRELMHLIKDVNNESRIRGTSFEFSVVSPNRSTDRMNIRSIGVTINGTRGVDDAKTLADCKFEIGDYIDVAVVPPRAAARPSFSRRGDGPRVFQRGDSDRRRY